MAEPSVPLQNRLIAALPEADYMRLLPQLELTPLPLGSVLQDPGKVQEYAFFPVSGVASLFQVMEGGLHEQIAVVGHEGAVGIKAFVDGESISTRAVVQSPGFAYRITSSDLKHELVEGNSLRYLLERFMATVCAQETRTMACNRQHAVEEQLCRWLLLGLDRHSSNDMTTSVVADMLGVGRKGVAEAAASLEAAGLITHAAGRMVVLDRAKLELRACECYAAVRQEIQRFLGSTNAR